MTIPAESFYRAETRASLSETLLPPFPQKLSKLPKLSSGLITLSPNTANEEICFYDGKDSVNKTVTITKRGIKWDSQTLTTDGLGGATGDYNNSEYMKKHSQGDLVQSDVTHLHLIQDYGDLDARKLDKAGGTRTSMGTAQNIGATNSSTAITVADTTGWTNGASITGTGIPASTTIVSFVPNTSAVLSNAFTGTTGTVSVIVGRRQAIEIDENNNEVKKPIQNGTSISSSETIRKRKADGTYEEVPYSSVLADMSLSGGGGTITPYESTIILNDLVGMTSDGLFECQTEIASSVNITGSTINVLLGQASLDATRTLFLFSVTTQAFACVGTLTNNTMVYGTAVSVSTIASNNFSGGCALIDTDKVAIVTNDTGTQVVRNRIATISGNVITLGNEYTQTLSVGGGNNNTITGVVKVRSTAYAWSAKSTVTGYNTAYVQTVSGTVITTNDTRLNPAVAGNASFFGNMIYLQDNRVAMLNFLNGSSPNFVAYIFDVNPSGTNATTTYTFAGDLGFVFSSASLARLNSSEFVVTYGSGLQQVDKFSISGASLVRTSAFVASLGGFYNTVEIETGYFGIIIGTTINVYDIKGTLLGTISGITVPPYSNQMIMRNARLTYITGTNGTTRIINFARIFNVGIATNATGGVKFFGVQSYTGVLPNQKYYIQDNGSLGVSPTAYYVGKGITANNLFIE